MEKSVPGVKCELLDEVIIHQVQVQFDWVKIGWQNWVQLLDFTHTWNLEYQELLDGIVCRQSIDMLALWELDEQWLLFRGNISTDLPYQCCILVLGMFCYKTPQSNQSKVKQGKLDRNTTSHQWFKVKETSCAPHLSVATRKD